MWVLLNLSTRVDTKSDVLNWRICFNFRRTACVFARMVMPLKGFSEQRENDDATQGSFGTASVQRMYLAFY